MGNIKVLLEKEWLEFKQQRALLPSIIASYSVVGEKTNQTHPLRQYLRLG